MNNNFPRSLSILVSQYGTPSPELIPQFRSLLQDTFFDHPREMNLLIAGLEEGIPKQLGEKKGVVPYEILSEQMADRLENTRGMTHDAAEWVVRTWAEAIEYDIPVTNHPSDDKKEKIPVNISSDSNPVQSGKSTTNSNRNSTPMKKEENKQEKGNLPLIIFGVIGIIIAVILIFALTGFYSPPVTDKSDTSEAWDNKGMALVDLKKYDEAIEAFDKALNIDPDFAKAWIGKGLALFGLNKYDEAIKAYDKALEIDPRSVENWHTKGAALNDLERYDEAIEAFNRALEIDSEHPNSWVGKGLALFGLKKYDEAIKAYDKALDIDPDFLMAWSSKGWALIMLDKYDDAIEVFDKALQIDPEFSDAWNSKGVALWGLDKDDEALKAFDKALEIDPENLPAKNNKKLTLEKLSENNHPPDSPDTIVQPVSTRKSIDYSPEPTVSTTIRESAPNTGGVCSNGIEGYWAFGYETQRFNPDGTITDQRGNTYDYAYWRKVGDYYEFNIKGVDCIVFIPPSCDALISVVSVEPRKIWAARDREEVLQKINGDAELKPYVASTRRSEGDFISKDDYYHDNGIDDANKISEYILKDLGWDDSENFRSYLKSLKI